ncbi:MAG: phenylacetate--CoA ligase family protein [Parvibaculum sp.]|nr:phenylacetate--CoA ligase family protein [Parvibaculum sp.]
MRFERLPRPIRASAVAAYGYRNRLLRYGREFHLFREFLLSTDNVSLELREAYQLRELQYLLKHSAANAPAWRDLPATNPFLEAGADLSRCLSGLPVVEKSDMRRTPERFVNRSIRSAMTSSTSGSTGSPMTFGHDRKSLQRRAALIYDHRRIAHLPARARGVRLSGRIICEPGVDTGRPWLFNPAEQQVFVSTYHLNSKHATAITGMLLKFRPDYVDGYPSAVLELLRLLASCGARVDSIKSIITTAETLNPETRDEIEIRSGAKVLDYYAASEGVPPIQQCLFGTYHVRWQAGLFEVLGADGIALDGDGELVCTSFIQNRNPLIRYRTGDLVSGYRQEGGKCACGIRSPTVRSLLGRVEDHVITPDGRKIGMFTYRTLKTIVGIEMAQVIQYDYDRFDVSVVLTPDAQVNTVEEFIRSSFERALGYQVYVQLQIVDQIPKGPNGKIRSVICRIP